MKEFSFAKEHSVRNGFWFSLCESADTAFLRAFSETCDRFKPRLSAVCLSCLSRLMVVFSF